MKPNTEPHLKGHLGIALALKPNTEPHLKEHLGIALALKLPVYVVITKVDMCPENVLEKTIERLIKEPCTLYSTNHST